MNPHRTPSRTTKTNVWLALVLLSLPPLMYGSQIGRWGIDRDEVYTLVDSSMPISKLLEWETKPVYYFLCHGLLKLNLGLPTEVTLRLPSAIAAGFVPLVAYLGLRRGGRSEKAALGTAILLWASPWLLGFAVTARFYGLVTLLVLVAVVGLVQWYEHRQARWLLLFLLAALLAMATHTTVATLIPAGLAGWAITCYRENPQAAGVWIRKWGPGAVTVALLSAAIAWAFLADQFRFWLNSEPHQFGNYTLSQLLLALLVNVGIPIWGLAVLPLGKPLSHWQGIDALLVVLVVLGLGPLLLLVPLGGGVAPPYLLAGIIPLFVLAGRHWSDIDDQLRPVGFRLAFACGILSFSIPSMASTLQNGGHFDYRNAAAYLDTTISDDTIVAASGHLNLEFFLPHHEVLELGTFEQGLPRDLLQSLIQRAEREDCRLLLLSRETRFLLDADDQEWFYRRFALLRDFETLRYDHRRHRVAIYEYRPQRFETRHDLSQGLTMISAETGITKPNR